MKVQDRPGLMVWFYYYYYYFSLVLSTEKTNSADKETALLWLLNNKENTKMFQLCQLTPEVGELAYLIV